MYESFDSSSSQCVETLICVCVDERDFTEGIVPWLPRQERYDSDAVVYARVKHPQCSILVGTSVRHSMPATTNGGGQSWWPSFRSSASWRREMRVCPDVNPTVQRGGLLTACAIFSFSDAFRTLLRRCRAGGALSSSPCMSLSGVAVAAAAIARMPPELRSENRAEARRAPPFRGGARPRAGTMPLVSACTCDCA